MYVRVCVCACVSVWACVYATLIVVVISVVSGVRSFGLVYFLVLSVFFCCYQHFRRLLTRFSKYLFSLTSNGCCCCCCIAVVLLWLNAIWALCAYIYLYVCVCACVCGFSLINFMQYTCK